jgi:hypothetical protein
MTAAYIRRLSSLDLDRCAALESAAFPPSEAATYEKVWSSISRTRLNIDKTVD